MLVSAKGAEAAIARRTESPPGHLTVGGQFVDQPCCVGDFTTETLTGEHPLECFLLADDTWQRGSYPEAGMKPEPAEVGRKFRGGRGHPEVCAEGKPESAADRAAVYRGDDRLAGAEQPDGLA